MTQAKQPLPFCDIWANYCEAIKQTGLQLLSKDNVPTDRFNQAEAIRYLSRMVRAGLESMVEAAEPEFPRFANPANSFIKIGADNPDNIYQAARIRGHLNYRIHGSRGSVATINFATKKGGYQKSDKAMLSTGFLDGRDLHINADGSFEIIMSAQKPTQGNWLPLQPDSNMVLIRQTFHNRNKEVAADLNIECINQPREMPPIDPDTLAARLAAAAKYTDNTVKLFSDWSVQFKRDHYNTLPLADQSMFQAAGGDPNITYYHGYWELAEDEAMIITTKPPQCEFWNFQVDNFWMESLDYENHTIHLNNHTVQPDEDGNITIVIAHTDPDHPNWLTTAGHGLGTSLFRLIGADNPPNSIATRIVKLSDIAGDQA